MSADTPQDSPQAAPSPLGGNGTAAMSPGDEAPPGTPGTGESICRTCGGSGRDPDRRICPECNGTGKVTVGIGGA
ncbi:conserved hypothetical protein [Burkholderiales bacterium 8X]|nr:conserved hypothetical protein [Burkholderiales bacterium 8X]